MEHSRNDKWNEQIKFSTQFRFVDHEFMDTLITVWNPGLRGEKPAINRQNKSQDKRTFRPLEN
jgi:hypothetical protein